MIRIGFLAVCVWICPGLKRPISVKNIFFLCITFSIFPSVALTSVFFPFSPLRCPLGALEMLPWQQNQILNI